MPLGLWCPHYTEKIHIGRIPLCYYCVMRVKYVRMGTTLKCEYLMGLGISVQYFYLFAGCCCYGRHRPTMECEAVQDATATEEEGQEVTDAAAWNVVVRETHCSAAEDLAPLLS